MLRNTVVGKAAVGPVNALDEEIINILTPQVDLIAANTEIKRLQGLLKTRDTPISSNNLLDRLTIVLKALAQRIAVGLLRSIKVIDPLLLIDGTNPIFNNQKL